MDILRAPKQAAMLGAALALTMAIGVEIVSYKQAGRYRSSSAAYSIRVSQDARNAQFSRQFGLPAMPRYGSRTKPVPWNRATGYVWALAGMGIYGAMVFVAVATRPKPA